MRPKYTQNEKTNLLQNGAFYRLTGIRKWRMEFLETLQTCVNIMIHTTPICCLWFSMFIRLQKIVFFSLLLLSKTNCIRNFHLQDTLDKASAMAAGTFTLLRFCWTNISFVFKIFSDKMSKVWSVSGFGEMLLHNRIQTSQKSFNSNICSLPDFEQIRTHCFELFCYETIHFLFVFAFCSRIYSILSSIYFSKVFYFFEKKRTDRIQPSLLCLWKISTRSIFFVFCGISVVEIIQFHFRHFLQIFHTQTSENRQLVESVLVV